MKCSNCKYCWQEENEIVSRCHYEGDYSKAPCEIELAQNKTKQFARTLANRYTDYWGKQAKTSLLDELTDKE